MPLRFLKVTGSKLVDCSPLRGMPLRELHMDFQWGRDEELLRSFPNLEKINDKPAAEFWKEVEAQRKK
jgi:hypothetical protein